MSAQLLIFDTKTSKKPLWNRLPLGAILFSIFSGFRCHLGRQHDTEDLTKTPKHSSRGSPKAAQELCRTAHELCKTSFNTCPERSRPPRTSKTLKKTPKGRWGTPLRASFLAPTWMHLGSLTQLLCDFLRGAMAGSQLCCALDIYIYIYIYIHKYIYIYIFKN